MLLDRVLLYVAMALVSLALLAFIWVAVRLVPIRSGSRRQRECALGYCPTSHASWWFDLLLPYRYFLWQTCGYDLSRQPPLNERGEVRCPECGQITTPRRVHRGRYRFRPGRASVACLLLGSGCLIAVSSRTEDWIPWTPTYALVAIQEAGMPWHEIALRRELSKRVNDGGESKWVASRLARLLVTDLHSDEVEWNAYVAMRQLDDMADVARPALFDALRSTDWQQRQLAFIALARIEERCELTAAEPRIVDVALEALRDDSEWYYQNAVVGMNYLYRHGAAEPGVRRRIRQVLGTTDDPQQRLLCAVVCGHLADIESLDAAYPILVECLQDNTISGDAKFVAPALAAFGPPVTARLEATRAATPDAQQALLVDLLLFDLGAASAPARRPWVLPNLGRAFQAPLQETSLDQSLDDNLTYWLDDYVAAHRPR